MAPTEHRTEEGEGRGPGWLLLVVALALVGYFVWSQPVSEPEGRPTQNVVLAKAPEPERAIGSEPVDAGQPDCPKEAQAQSPVERPDGWQDAFCGPNDQGFSLPLLGPYVERGVGRGSPASRSEEELGRDAEVFRRAAVVTADSIDDAKVESADLMRAVEAGAINWEQVRELGHVVAGLMPGRTSATDITVFESHGLALWDVAAAGFVYRRAIEQGLGTPLPF